MTEYQTPPTELYKPETQEFLPVTRLAKQINRPKGRDKSFKGKPYFTQHAADSATIASMHKRGHTPEMLLEYYRDLPEQPGLSELARTNPNKALRKIEKQCRKAERLEHEPGYVYNQRVGHEFLVRSFYAPLSGRTSETDRRTLYAFALTVIETGKFKIHLSLGDLQEKARCSLLTARRSLERLQEQGLIVKAKQHNFRAATEWVLGIEQMRLFCPDERILGLNDTLSGLTGSEYVTLCENIYAEVSLPTHGAFEHRINGRGAERVRAIAAVHGPLPTCDIARITGKSNDVTAKTVKKLARESMVSLQPASPIEVPALKVACKPTLKAKLLVVVDKCFDFYSYAREKCCWGIAIARKALIQRTREAYCRRMKLRIERANMPEWFKEKLLRMLSL